MERLTERTSDGILVKEDYGEEVLKTLYQCYGAESMPHYANCDEGYCAMEKLAEYEDLEERLQNIYGEHHGLLNEVVASLERHEKIDLPQPVIKSRLLTDEDVDQWDKWNTLKKQGKLPELPCAVGDTYYRIENDGVNPPRVREWKVRTLEFCVNVRDCIGKTVFLTREEAEAALKELKGKK